MQQVPTVQAYKKNFIKKIRIYQKISFKKKIMKNIHYNKEILYKDNISYLYTLIKKKKNNY